jgi:hypothetical protein
VTPPPFLPTSLRLAILALVGAALSSRLHADNWAPNLTGTALWNSNASLGSANRDQIDALLFKADVLASESIAVGRQDVLVLRGHFAGDWWPWSQSLLSGAAGGRAEWQHTFGTEPFAPVVSIEGSADGVEVRDQNRRGIHLGGTVSIRKRLTDLARITLWHQVAWFDARNATFDSGASETALELDRDITDVARLTFTARFRDGDVVSYAGGLRPDIDALATSRLAVTTFDRAMTAYRIDAKTWSGRAALTRAIDQQTALSLGYEYRKTDRGFLNLGEHLVSLSVIHQF